MSKLGKAFRAEFAYWHLDDTQRALLMAFTYCLDLRMRGVDFDRHWDALCGQDRTEELGRDYYT